uniref:G protein-coupled receptor n=1 Tax=Panagrellus redivivus TaxID=6233 RepID=A0A7E4VK77_PANRE
MAKYWSCDARTHDEWVALGQPSMFIGILYLTIGIVYLIIYIPCFIALIRSDLMKFSAFKFMAFLGVIDFIGLFNATFYCSYAAMIGMIYCMAPTLNYVMGVWAFTCWATCSTTCVLLAANRCIDLVSPNFGRLLYAGKKTYIWFIIPVLYALYFIFFAGSCVFNSNTYAYAFDPFLGVPERHGQIDIEHYPHMSLAVHNLAIPIALIIIYVSLCIILSAQTRGIHGLRSQNLGRVQRNTLIQAMMICSVDFIGALLYSYSNFFPVGKIYVIGGQIGWMSVHGVSGLTYLLFNKTIRNDVIRMFCKNRIKITQTVTPATGHTSMKATASSTQAY